MGYKIVKLRDVCNIYGGFAFKSNDFVDEGIPLIRIGNIFERKVNINENTVYLKEDLLDKFSNYIINKGDILVALSGATTGKYGTYTFDKMSLLNQRVGKITPNEKSMEPQYLYHYLEVLKAKILDKAAGAAQPNISPQQISDMEIPLPPIETQRKIAEVLDKAQQLIDKRKEQIEKLDKFLQSIFLDMFGDLVRNHKKWDVKTISELTGGKNGAIKCGPFGSQLLISELTREGIPVLGIENVQKNKFVYIKTKCITSKKFESLKGFIVKKRDVLISRTGTVGRTCVIPDNFSYGIIGPNLLKVSLDERIFLPIVLSSAFNYSEAVINQIKSLSPGATVPVFNTTNLKNVKLVVPPLDLQNKFAAIVEKVEQQKEIMQKSLTEMENNFNSIMQKAFKGELF